MNIFIDTQDMEERYGEELYKEYLENENKQLKSILTELEELWEEQQKRYRYIKDNRYRRFLSKNLDKIQELKEKYNLGDKENINNNAEDIEDLDARITRAEEQYDKQKEEMILGDKENE